MISSRHADLLDRLDAKTYGIIAFVQGEKGVQIAFRQEVAEMVKGSWMGNYRQYVNREFSEAMKRILELNKFQMPQSEVNTIYKNFPEYDVKKGRDYAHGLVAGLAMQWGFKEPEMKVSTEDHSILFVLKKI